MISNSNFLLIGKPKMLFIYIINYFLRKQTYGLEGLLDMVQRVLSFFASTVMFVE